MAPGRRPGAAGLDPATVGPLEPGDVEAAARVLARAFADNPVNVAAIDGKPASPSAGAGDASARVRRARCNLWGMRALLPVAIRHGLVLAARLQGVTVGCLVAAPPLAYPLPPPSIAARLRVRWGQGTRVMQRWAEVFHTLDRVHPRVAHWYLASIGVEPEFQRAGVGAALLEALLRRVNRAGLPTYLETDRRETLRFYQRWGFRAEAPIQVLGVPAWRMWREATPAGTGLRPGGRPRAT